MNFFLEANGPYAGRKDVPNMYDEYKAQPSANWRTHAQRWTELGASPRVNSTQLTLREFDGRIQSIPVDSTTTVIRLGRHLPLSALARRWRVVVLWPPIGAAQSVDVERIPRTRINQGF